MGIKDRVTENKLASQEEVIHGLIELWSDVYYAEKYLVRGKPYTAHELKPHIKAAFAEPNSHVYGAIIDSPQKALATVKYASIPAQVRNNPIVQNWISQALKDEYNLCFVNYVFYLAAMLHITFQITFTEAEERLEQSFIRMLSRINLRQLLSGKDIPDEFRLHTWLDSLPLFPRSIAGANARLYKVLRQRLTQSDGHTSFYEQDMKIALWMCWKGNCSYDVLIKKLIKDSDIAKQIFMLQRIPNGGEPKINRTLCLATLRKAIEDLPDIHQEIRNLQTQGRELPLTEEILSALTTRHEQYESPLDNFLDMITKHGVDISRLDTRDLELLSDELNRLKYSITRKENYGEKENQRKQQLKYLGKRLKS